MHGLKRESPTYLCRIKYYYKAVNLRAIGALNGTPGLLITPPHKLFNSVYRSNIDELTWNYPHNL